MRRDAEAFGEETLELVQLARRLKEARGVETALDEEDVEYLLETGPYAARMLFVIPVTRVGVYFYVREEEAAGVREILRDRGYTITEVLEEETPSEA